MILRNLTRSFWGIEVGTERKNLSMQRFGRSLRLLCSVLVVAAIAAGQYTSQQISGVVRDSSGAVVIGAKVTARQTGTGLSRTAVSSDTGAYVIPNIPIGDYELTVESAGFKTLKQTGINVSVNSKVGMDLNLEVGQVTESVTVTADVAMVETTTGEVGRLVTGEQATKMQLNGRNFAQLLALLPGVSTTNRSSFDLFGGYGSNMSAQSINGGRTYTASWNIDGADNKDNGGGGNNFVNVNPDAIAEFKVMTSNYSAEYGQNAGAVINLALKSGTRDFHGAAYEYVRNDAFDAYAFRATSKQKLRFNNFGGNLGGPVYIPGKFNEDRSKLFFFAGVEYKRLRQGSPSFWNIPPLTLRSGDFSSLPASQQPKDVANGNAPFAGGIVPSSRFSKNGKALVDLYPQPNYTGTGGNFTYYPPNPLDSNQYIVKGDYYINPKHQIAVHWTKDYYTSLQNTGNKVTYNRNIPGLNTSAKWTMIANATTVNTFQFTYTGNVILQTNFQPNPIFGSSYARKDLGVNYPMIYGNETSVPNLSISGFNSLNTAPRNWNNFNRVFQWKDDFSKIIGSHNLKFGALAMRSRKNQDNQPSINGSVNFSPGHALHSGNPLADALLGNFNSYTEASAGREGWFRFSQFEFYAQDNWRATSRLTLDFGLRWMIMQPQYAALQNAVVFAPRFFDASRAPSILASNGQIVAGTGDPANGLVVGGSDYPEAFRIRFASYNDPLYKSVLRGLPKEISSWEKGLLGPRFGFAYDVTGKQTTVVRGGYGILYERIQGNFVFGRVNNPPFIQESQLFSANIENPAGGSQRIVPSNVSSYDIDVKIPTVNNYSLGVQHKLGSSMLLDVAFVGSAGWNQYRQRNLNQLPLGTLQANKGINTNALRPYRGYANINHYITGSNFNYNSLQLQWKKQFAGAGMLNIAYTWSKSITDASDWGETAMDSYDFKRDRGLASYDRRNIFVFSYIYPLPFWRQQDTWYKVAFGGWQFSGVTTLQAGRPLDIGIQGDSAGIGQGGQRPNLVGEVFPTGTKTAKTWFNTAAFAVPAAGTFGNLGRNAVVGPGTNNWDISLQKIFSIREKQALEFRAEFYNAPNHFSYYGVATTVGASNFGQVTSATDPRTLQFGLRYSF